MTSIISLLPFEVWSHIFQLAQPVRSANKLPIEIVLSHVCRQFRAWTLDLPVLWSAITISASEVSHNRARTYLSRSSTYPIDIIFDVYQFEVRKGSASSLNVTDGAWLIIAPHLLRCRSFLVLASTYETMIEARYRLERCHMPLLERLAIPSSSDQEDFVQLSLPIYQGSSPRLSYIQMGSWDFHRFSKTRPLNQLTRLEIQFQITDQRIFPGENPLDHLCEALKETLSLVYLSLSGTTDCLHLLIAHQYGSSAESGPLVHVPCLCAVRFMGESNLITYFLLRLSAPELISISFMAADRALGNTDLYDLNSKSIRFPRLEYLNLVGRGRFHISTLARIFPTITYLNLTHTTLTSLDYLRGGHLPWNDVHTVVFRTRSMDRSIWAVADFIKTASRKDGQPLKFLFDGETYREVEEALASSSTDYDNLDIISRDNLKEPWWILSHDDPSNIRLSQIS